MKKNCGQLEQEIANLKQELVNLKITIKKGFRIENGNLVKYTNDGRKRNNWKNHYRHLSKKFLKDKCENRRCNTIHDLTIHHKKALSTAKTEKELRELCENEDNCQTLCEKCHGELERRINLKKNGKKKIKKVKKIKKKRKKGLKINLSKITGLNLVFDEWGSYKITG